MKTLETLLEQCILLSRWLLAPIYLALAAVLVLFTVKAFQEVIHLYAIITIYSDITAYLKGETPVIKSILGLSIIFYGLLLYQWKAKKWKTS